MIDYELGNREHRNDAAPMWSGCHSEGADPGRAPEGRKVSRVLSLDPLPGSRL